MMVYFQNQDFEDIVKIFLPGFLPGLVSSIDPFPVVLIDKR